MDNSKYLSYYIALSDYNNDNTKGFPNVSYIDNDQLVKYSYNLFICDDTTNLPLMNVARENNWVLPNVTKLTTLDSVKINTFNNSLGEYSVFTENYDIESLNELEYFINIDQSNFKKVFFYCFNLRKIKLSPLIFNHINDMTLMLAKCTNLSSTNIQDWEMDNVQYIQGLFEYCESLGPELDLSSWNTSKFKDIHYTFNRCYNLKKLNVSGWDTSNITDMRAFIQFTAIEELDLSTWDLSNVTTMRQMFNECQAIKKIIMRGPIRSDVDTSIMFDFRNNSGEFHYAGGDYTPFINELPYGWKAINDETGEVISIDDLTRTAKYYIEIDESDCLYNQPEYQ